MLTTYKQKRNFKKTSEPEGLLKKEDGKKIFVVQKHFARRLHYDLRLEKENVLKSWAVPKGPSMNPKDKRLAMRVEDHPYEYAEFYGEIPEGEYGAGKVEIWDKGEVSYLKDDFSEHLIFNLDGRKLKGEFSLVKIKNKQERGSPWLLIKHPYSLEPLPNIKPMLATTFGQPFNKKGWFFEIKWDGYRAMAVVADEILLYSRNEKILNDQFYEIVESLKDFGHIAVLDGEIVALDSSGEPKFQYLQSRSMVASGTLVYYVFDLIYLDGKDLTKMPLFERKNLLRNILEKNDRIRFSDHVEEKGEDLFREIVKKNIEGIIAKDSKSPYVEGHSKDWKKIKAVNRQEAIICGYTAPKKSRHFFGALILGVYEKKQLIYVGHCGTGFSEQGLSELFKKMEFLKTKNCPFEKIPKTNEPATWLEPKLIAEIKFTEWTNEGLMRHPVFLGLRDDKISSDVKKE